jgi:tRNA nucleotidyltransferase (CCA-adding enzyme)
MLAPAATVAPLLSRWLPADTHRLLAEAGKMLAAHDWHLYAVGGMVRDALLGLPFRAEADLVVVGDGVAAAEALAAARGGKVTARSPFGTATLVFAGLTVDVVTARSETYPQPGALPVVTPSGLEADLRRRDFTINAMAVDLSPERWGALYDPCGGRDDLAAGLVRTLHAGSFRDDPTRMVRAVRYAVRLGFQLAGETAAELAHHRDGLQNISGVRRWHELERALHEPDPAACLAELEAQGLLAALHPALRCDGAAAERFARWRTGGLIAPASTAALLCLLLWDTPPGDTEGTIRDLSLPGSVAKPLQSIAQIVRLALALDAPEPDRAALTAALDEAPAETVIAAASALPQPRARGRVKAYLALWRHVRPQLRGDDLLREGVAPGPPVGRYLSALRTARLQEWAKSPDEERWLVRDWLAHGGPAETKKAGA